MIQNICVSLIWQKLPHEGHSLYVLITGCSGFDSFKFGVTVLLDENSFAFIYTILIPQNFNSIMISFPDVVVGGCKLLFTAM